MRTQPKRTANWRWGLAVFSLLVVWVVFPFGDEFDADYVERPRPTGVAVTEADYLEVYHKQMELCGKLCEPDATPPSLPIRPTLEYLQSAYVETDLVCRRLFSKKASALFDGKPLEWPPPQELPMQDKFLLPGVKLGRWFKVQQYQDTHVAEWSREFITQQVEMAANGTLHGTYGIGVVQEMRAMLQQQAVQGKRVLVVGTEKPWLEAVLLSLDAASVTTLEYGTIISAHPALHTMTPGEMNQLYMTNRLDKFDLAVTYSSLEHSGLGRYGDRLSPWGDVVWTAKLSCIVKQGGMLVIGLPTADEDEILYNAQRNYARKRWPLVLQNWRTVGMELIGDAAVVIARSRL
ncbi:hypothetical protein BASA81_007888 [Batrachochytrium salamandrivorans]|nr:hypothetical protein BASA81_007888 [Batrachochytrium salamandrivorans]